MSLDYTYYRPTAPEEELSAYFSERLGLRRSFEQDTFPIYGDRWWGTHHYDTAEEYDVEAERLGIEKSGELSILVFELDKFLSTEESRRAHLDLFGAVLDQLNETSTLTGILMFGDVDMLIERRFGGPICLDSILADPEVNEDHYLDPILARGTVTKLVNFDLNPNPVSSEEG